MVSVRQLELNLEVAFEEAAEMPETADVLSLWAQFEGDLAGLEQRDHLRVAGDILVQLAGLCEAKADLRLCIELEKFWPLRLRPRLVQGSEV